MRPPVSQPLALDALESCQGTGGIVNVTIAVAEVEFMQVTLQMLLAAVLAIHLHIVTGRRILIGVKSLPVSTFKRGNHHAQK